MNANDGKQTGQAKAETKPVAGDSASSPNEDSQPSRTSRLREYQKEGLSHPKPYFACHADVMGGMLEAFGPVKQFTMKVMNEMVENPTEDSDLPRKLSPMIKLGREITRHASFLLKLEEYYEKKSARQTSTKPAAATVDPLRANSRR